MKTTKRKREVGGDKLTSIHKEREPFKPGGKSTHHGCTTKRVSLFVQICFPFCNKRQISII